MKRFLTTLVNERTIMALRLWATEEGLIVRRGPRPGEASVAKLLDALADNYLQRQVSEHKDASRLQI